MASPKTVKKSIALAVTAARQNGRVILVRRPEDDEDFPGMSGLPAASCQPGETLRLTAAPIGVQKLGAAVEVGPVLATGTQQRAGYTLEMTLFEARLVGDAPALPSGGAGEIGHTLYTDWRWGEAMELRASADHGSLCSQLLLKDRWPATDPG